jgi:cytochrome c553
MRTKKVELELTKTEISYLYSFFVGRALNQNLSIEERSHSREVNRSLVKYLTDKQIKDIANVVSKMRANLKKADSLGNDFAEFGEKLIKTINQVD